MPQKKNRMDDRQLSQMLGLMQDAPVPDLPEDFQKNLHLKLVQTAQEKRAHKGWLMHGWRTAVPAFLCLVLVLGVFSSGLFDRLQREEIILSQETESAAPVISEPVQTEKPVQNVKPEPVPEKTPVPQQATEKQPEATADTTTPAMYRRGMVSDYRVVLTQPLTEYLQTCKTETQMDWTEKASVLTETHAILQLTQTEWETLSEYIKTTGLQPESFAESGEMVVVEIVGCEG
ncbi:MAG: hypothetical protein IJB80_04720 [Clostridia bacterium]|nr:hypothetical protein [Clostridia bacterium]